VLASFIFLCYICLHEIRLQQKERMENIINTILFGKYEILSLLGTGQFSPVYLSKHLVLECYRAIKVIPKTPGQTDTLLKEARLLKSLQHPGIPIIYDVEEDDFNFYLVEEYLEGDSLEDFLLQQSHISQHTFTDLSLQLCDIFRYLHTQKPTPILYLDLKPEHIIVCGMQLKLIDFNVATYLSSLGNIYNLFGNKEFSAPELFSGTTPSLCSDIYSIGKIMEYLSNYVEPSTSPKFQQIIQKATLADPAHRFETVDALISAINQEKNDMSQPYTRKKIAVCGSHSGCGATHIAIALVSTLNYMGYSSIYYAKNGQFSLQQTQYSLSFFKEINGMFYYKYFKGYPFYGPGIQIPEPDKTICVYDYGDDFILDEIDADYILFICSNSIWQWHNAIKKSASLTCYKDRLTIICNMGQKRSMETLSKYFSHSVYRYPYDANAFCVDTPKLSFVQRILGINRRKNLFFRLKNRFIRKK